MLPKNEIGIGERIRRTAEIRRPQLTEHPVEPVCVVERHHGVVAHREWIHGRAGYAKCGLKSTLTNGLRPQQDNDKAREGDVRVR